MLPLCGDLAAGRMSGILRGKKGAPMYWNDLSSHLKAVYGTKVYKLSLSSGCTCPNRDGTLGSRGCIFCDGAGTFAAAGDIRQQLAAAKARVAAKAGPNARYIAYFQSFTNTYGPVDRLRQLYTAALEPEEIQEPAAAEAAPTQTFSFTQKEEAEPELSAEAMDQKTQQFQLEEPGPTRKGAAGETGEPVQKPKTIPLARSAKLRICEKI